MRLSVSVAVGCIVYHTHVEKNHKIFADVLLASFVNFGSIAVLAERTRLVSCDSGVLHVADPHRQHLC